MRRTRPNTPYQAAHEKRSPERAQHPVSLPKQSQVDDKRIASRPSEIFGKSVIYYSTGDFHRADGRVIEGITFIGIK